MTPADRYERYLAWCKILGAKPASFRVYLQEVAKVPERMPLAWYAGGNPQRQFA